MDDKSKQTKQAQTFDAMIEGWTLGDATLAPMADRVVICRLEFRREGAAPQRILATVSEEAAPAFYAHLLAAHDTAG